MIANLYGLITAECQCNWTKVAKNYGVNYSWNLTLTSRRFCCPEDIGICPKSFYSITDTKVL